ncbi:MAG TPA: DUF2147 domain-containing protein [Terracidiphilus sp.]|nr:DUF2147 domain-containing protein [Terracidiphilus sp.]
MRWKMQLVLMLLFSAPAAAYAQSGGILGQWEDPGGSVLAIVRCGKDVCIRIDAISPRAPALTDIHNPDRSLRSRPLCGLEIGRGFQMTGDRQAQDGTLYDPKSGNTYHGQMKMVGGELHLRGYIGFSIFGRTEIWRRPAGEVRACTADRQTPGHSAGL